MPEQSRAYKEEFKVKGAAVVDKVKELVHEGNVRRIVIKDAEGKTVIELPVTVGVVSVLVAPIAAAVGTVAALASDFSIEVERQQGQSDEDELVETNAPS